MVGVDDDSAAAIAERGPAVRFAEDISSDEFSRPHFFIPPEYVALRVFALGEQAVCETDGLHSFAIEDRADVDAGLFFEIVENGFGIDLVLGAVGDDIGGA
jgi:hypothetical protein